MSVCRAAAGEYYFEHLFVRPNLMDFLAYDRSAMGHYGFEQRSNVIRSYQRPVDMQFYNCAVNFHALTDRLRNRNSRYENVDYSLLCSHCKERLSKRVDDELSTTELTFIVFVAVGSLPMFPAFLSDGFVPEDYRLTCITMDYMVQNVPTPSTPDKLYFDL